MRLSSLLLPLALLLCLAVLIAAARPDKPYRSPSYTLHNRKLQLAAALEDAAVDPVWMLGCIADGAYSVEMTIAGQGPFVMMFDTGSTTTAVLSTLCHNDTECASDLGNRLNVSEGVSDGRLVGPYGNTSVDFGASGFSGPLYDATISLTGTPHSLDTVVRFVPIAAARYFLNSSWYCPFDTHSKGHDFSVGIVGAGLPSPRLGDGSTDALNAASPVKGKAAKQTELDRYVAHPQEDDRAADPLAWWQLHERKYPKIAMLTRRYLAISASSAASDRLFSRLKLTAVAARQGLKPNTLCMLLFVERHQRK